MLEAELLALKTRRRQREQKAISTSKAVAAPGKSALARHLRDELIELQKKREVLAEKTRELQHTKLRVRPKDIKTLERARALVEPKVGDHAKQAQADADKAAEVQATIDKLARRQREQLQLSQRGRAIVERELIEERILREELAAEHE